MFSYFSVVMRWDVVWCNVELLCEVLYDFFNDSCEGVIVVEILVVLIIKKKKYYVIDVYVIVGFVKRRYF